MKCEKNHECVLGSNGKGDFICPLCQHEEIERLRRIVGNRADYADEEFEEAWRLYLNIRKKIRRSDDDEEKKRLMNAAMNHARKYGLNDEERRAERAEAEIERLRAAHAESKAEIKDLKKRLDIFEHFAAELVGRHEGEIITEEGLQEIMVRVRNRRKESEKP